METKINIILKNILMCICWFMLGGLLCFLVSEHYKIKEYNCLKISNLVENYKNEKRYEKADEMVISIKNCLIYNGLSEEEILMINFLMIEKNK